MSFDIFRELARITRSHCEIQGYTKTAAAQVQVNAGEGKLKSDGHPSQATGESRQAGYKPAPAAVTPIDRDSELYGKLRKPAPQIWESVGRTVFKRGYFFCGCENDETARYITDRLNAFDENLTERNTFQKLYLKAIQPPSEEEI